jgi:hypothetical protein
VTRNPQAHQQNYQSQLDQRVAAIEQATQQQQVYQRQQIEAYQQQQQQIAAENTERMLGQWAEGREHFDDVRVLMGHLLSPVRRPVSHRSHLNPMGRLTWKPPIGGQSGLNLGIA